MTVKSSLKLSEIFMLNVSPFLNGLNLEELGDFSPGPVVSFWQWSFNYCRLKEVMSSERHPTQRGMLVTAHCGLGEFKVFHLGPLFIVSRLFALVIRKFPSTT